MRVRLTLKRTWNIVAQGILEIDVEKAAASETTVQQWLFQMEKAINENGTLRAHLELLDDPADEEEEPVEEDTIYLVRTRQQGKPGAKRRLLFLGEDGKWGSRGLAREFSVKSNALREANVRRPPQGYETPTVVLKDEQ